MKQEKQPASLVRSSASGLEQDSVVRNFRITAKDCAIQRRSG
ncbi:MAG: hypothetical protein RBR42_02340 [Desulfomicrobium sp.]|nr:hypothetical protein [Desulfomicrobium sp.]